VDHCFGWGYQKLAQVDLLTDKRIRALRAQQKTYRIADGRAMYLLVSPAGAKLWRLKFRLDGKERVLALGQYPDVRIADARDKRDALHGPQASQERT
jgi:Arm DNA-binding domain